MLNVLCSLLCTPVLNATFTPFSVKGKERKKEKLHKIIHKKFHILVYGTWYIMKNTHSA